LEYFYTIAKYNSISKASEELYVSKSTLSSSLKSLEEEIGDQLFDRSGKKLSLNQKGMQVLAEVTIILKKMKNINLNLSHNLINSTIRVGVGNPSILHKLNQGNKEFDLNFSEGNSFDLLSLLSYEKLDCVITSANVNSTVLKKELIGEFSMLLCVSESVKQRILEDGISCLDDYQ
ncbi:LysR family transcriptional regulator, partial [Enterococcus faecalis]|nr:LysR family transcriptional regulator [Enterococcus faecalis]